MNTRGYSFDSWHNVSPVMILSKNVRGITGYQGAISWVKQKNLRPPAGLQGGLNGVACVHVRHATPTLEAAAFASYLSWFSALGSLFIFTVSVLVPMPKSTCLSLMSSDLSIMYLLP